MSIDLKYALIDAWRQGNAGEIERLNDEEYADIALKVFCKHRAKSADHPAAFTKARADMLDGWGITDQPDELPQQTREVLEFISDNIGPLVNNAGVGKTTISETAAMIRRMVREVLATSKKATKRESVTQALAMLHSMIDGGEECRGRDSEISDIIRLLEQGR